MCKHLSQSLELASRTSWCLKEFPVKETFTNMQAREQKGQVRVNIGGSLLYASMVVSGWRGNVLVPFMPFKARTSNTHLVPLTSRLFFWDLSLNAAFSKLLWTVFPHWKARACGSHDLRSKGMGCMHLDSRVIGESVVRHRKILYISDAWALGMDGPRRHIKWWRRFWFMPAWLHASLKTVFVAGAWASCGWPQQCWFIWGCQSSN